MNKSTEVKNKTMHTLLCEICLNVKPTGLSVSLYNQWRYNRGRRSAIERSIATLTSDFDIGLLHNGICFSCSCNNYDNCEGIEVSEYE